MYQMIRTHNVPLHFESTVFTTTQTIAIVMKILTNDYKRRITLFEMFLISIKSDCVLCIIVLKRGASVFKVFGT
jgi:hypothetical protein